jgi:hypothetical protein
MAMASLFLYPNFLEYIFIISFFFFLVALIHERLKKFSYSICHNDYIMTFAFAILMSLTSQCAVISFFSVQNIPTFFCFFITPENLIILESYVLLTPEEYKIICPDFITPFLTLDKLLFILGMALIKRNYFSKKLIKVEAQPLVIDEIPLVDEDFLPGSGAKTTSPEIEHILPDGGELVHLEPIKGAGESILEDVKNLLNWLGGRLKNLLGFGPSEAFGFREVILVVAKAIAKVALSLLLGVFCAMFQLAISGLLIGYFAPVFDYYVDISDVTPELLELFFGIYGKPLYYTIVGSHFTIFIGVSGLAFWYSKRFFK